MHSQADGRRCPISSLHLQVRGHHSISRGGGVIMSPLYREGETCSFTSHCISLSDVRAFIYPAGVQTRDVDPMSGFCWPTVYDAEPTLGYCVVFDATLNVGQRHRRRANINPGPMAQHSVEGLFIERKAV